MAEPTIDNFSEWIEWHSSKAQSAAEKAALRVRSRFSGAAGGNAMVALTEAVKNEFERGVEAVLGEVNRVQRKTRLDRGDLAQEATQVLQRLLAGCKSLIENEAKRSGRESIAAEPLASMDHHLAFALRQFDVGLFDPPNRKFLPCRTQSVSLVNQRRPDLAPEAVAFHRMRTCDHWT